VPTERYPRRFGRGVPGAAHASSAALNAGEPGMTPDAGRKSKPMPSSPRAGSGNLGTPCERMQAAYRSSVSFVRWNTPWLSGRGSPARRARTCTPRRRPRPTAGCSSTMTRPCRHWSSFRPAPRPLSMSGRRPRRAGRGQQPRRALQRRAPRERAAPVCRSRRFALLPCSPNSSPGQIDRSPLWTLRTKARRAATPSASRASITTR
jgi:hypothetical protein